MNYSFLKKGVSGQYNRLVIIIAAAFLIAWISKKDFGEWKATLWLVNYDLEFIKRGLIGSLLQFLNPEYFTQFNIIHSCSNITLYVLTLLFSIFVYSYYKKQGFLLSLCLLLAGFSLQQFAYDQGRLDQINYILLFISLFLLRKNHSNLILFVVTLISCLMLFITETSALIQIPVIFSALLFSRYPRENKIPIDIGFYVVAVAITFLFILIYGGLNVVDFDTWLLDLKKIAGFMPDPHAAEIIHRSLIDNLSYALNRLENPKMVSRFSMIFGVSLGAIMVMIKSWQQVRAHGDSYFVFLLWLPVFSGIPLFFLGIDFFRWIACIFLNYFIVLGFYLNCANSSFKMNIHSGWLYFWLLMSLYSGPFGVTLALPERMQLLKLYDIEQRF